MHRAPAAATARTRANRERYERILDVVRYRLDAGDAEGVLRSATVAANFAWRAPTGLLCDPGLERLVVQAVRGHGPGPVVDGQRDDGRVLHVLTEAYSVGGHTRLAWRWIGRDHRRGDVVLTNQGDPVPEPLRAAVEATGGAVHDLRTAVPDLAGRAVALRRLMDGADLVVVHTHPYDVVALAAASLPGSRPPVVLENHADHSFWVGLGGAEVISDFRVGGQQVSRTLRGVPPARLGLLPLPIDPPTSDAGSRAALIRSRTGMRADDVLAVAVADEYKVAPSWGRGMDGLVAQALAGHPRLRIVLVGVLPQGRWASLVDRFPGRLFPVGPVPDVDPYYAAADVYLNSYPVNAGTSVLEASAYGLPVLSLHDLTERSGAAVIYQSDSPGIAGLAHAERTEDDYLRRLRKLVRDPGLRAGQGAAAREAVLSIHSGPGWTASLEELYQQARQAPAADLDDHRDAAVDEDYGGMLVALVADVHTTPDVTTAAEPLHDGLDPQLAGDLFAATRRSEGASLSARVGPGWERDPAGTTRLLALAGRHPRLSVSLPFAAGDDAAGSHSVRVLTSLLAALGSTTADCGDISLDPSPPSLRGPAIAGQLDVGDRALDELEALLSSPCWDDPPVASGDPVRALSTAPGSHVPGRGSSVLT